MSRKGTKWTDEEIKLLKKYYKRGFSIKEIGENIDRTHSAIKAKVHILGISDKGLNLSKELLSDLYYEKRMTHKEISKKLDVSRSAITYWMIKHNLKPRKRMMSKEKLKKLYFGKNMTQREIGELLNVDQVTIHNWMKKYNIDTKNVASYIKKTNKQFVKEVKEQVGNEYNFLEKYKGVDVKLKVKHKNCDDIFQITPHSFLQGHRCPACSEEKRVKQMIKTHKKFISEVKEQVGDEYTVLDKYKKNDYKIKIRHNECGNIYKTTPTNFLNRRRCPACFPKVISELRRKTDEQFKDEVYDLVGDEYIFLEKYKRNDIEIKVKHNECGHNYKIKPTLFLNGSTCPKCSKCLFSKGERKIYDWLDYHNIDFDYESILKECKDKNNLRFDFAIFKDDNLLLLIEYDGKQHYKPVKLFGGEKRFYKQKRRDKIKNDYCEDNNIPLIRIPYWEKDNIEYILGEKLYNYGLLRDSINFKKGQSSLFPSGF